MPLTNIYKTSKKINLEFLASASGFCSIKMKNLIIENNDRITVPDINKKDDDDTCTPKSTPEIASNSSTFKDPIQEIKDEQDFMENCLGLGSVIARINGTSNGTLYYNDPDDLIGNKSYNMYCIMESDNSLRIDFLPVNPSTFDIKPTIPLSHPDSGTISHASNTSDASTYSSNTGGLKNDGKKYPDGVLPEDETYVVPKIIYRGSFPEMYLEKVEPFIGAFLFVNLLDYADD
ncbi:uncharacterized protein SCDLUD_003647 [Saccharomycodes ludwigii]|uniref:uncharacterized protein n=1 Tax=Saccharomycodes ludwigii TaxID=36035 RepID=UPI001E868235|nr:hypothetical protein SCDLUD_003647 [Saccharomycodes ludwigii]KAH3900651.1 hypothetical protein SCDLUD_003647 [Saccharomycodes ludwigii]